MPPRQLNREKMFLKRTQRKGHNYYLIAQNYREGGKQKSRQLAYLGRIDDPKKVERIRNWLKRGIRIEEIGVGQTVIHGAVACLLEVVKRHHIIEQIDKHVQKGSGLKAGLTIALLAISRLVKPEAKMHFQDFIRSTSLPKLTDVQVDLFSCENICHLMDYLDVATCKAIDLTRMEETERIDRSLGFHYDITSTYTFGHCNEDGIRGFSRDHRPDLEQVVIGMIVDSNHIPITCHVEPGNTSDMTIFPVEMKDLKQSFKLKHVVVVVDRGMVSEENINYVVDELGFGIVCMMRIGDNVCQEALAEAKNMPRRVLKKAHGEKGGNDKMEVTGVAILKEVYGKWRKLAVYHNPATAKQRAETRQRRLAQAEAGLKELQQSLEFRQREYKHIVVAVDKLTKRLKDFLNPEIVPIEEYNSFEFELVQPGETKEDQKRLNRQVKELKKFQDRLAARKNQASDDWIEKKLNKLLGGDRDRYKIATKKTGTRFGISWSKAGDNDYDDAIAKAESNDGWFVIMASDIDSTAEEILKIYEGKDGIEKAFGSMKNVIDLRPLFHHLDNRVKAHIWICMLAQYIRRMFEFTLEEKEIDMTFREAMRHLKKVYWNDLEVEIEGIRVKWNRETNYTAEQVQLLEAFGVAPIPTF